MAELWSHCGEWELVAKRHGVVQEAMGSGGWGQWQWQSLPDLSSANRFFVLNYTSKSSDDEEDTDQAK
jgi:hypothetical protein